MYCKRIILLIGVCFILASCHTQIFVKNGISTNSGFREISVQSRNGKLQLTVYLDSNSCYIRELQLDGENRLSTAGTYTGIISQDQHYSSKHLLQKPQVEVTDSTVVISNILYGPDSPLISEQWSFFIKQESIGWEISREYLQELKSAKMEFPKWNFGSLATWKAGILDNGGMVWCKYFRKPNDSYGVHTGGVNWWDGISGAGLSVQPQPAANTQIATKFSAEPDGSFSATGWLTAHELQMQHNLNRFVSGHADIFQPVTVSKGKTKLQYELSAINYNERYDRGHLPGINATAVRELLNTTARYGVVDNTIVGGNGWTSNWKCLHEPFFGRIAFALADSNYTRNLAATLDRERDEAMLPDGRVLSRWHGDPGDQIPGSYNPKTGYYEAQWGYTIDSQTGYVINVCELFDLIGSIDWLRTHQQSVENALNWLLRRDANHNSLYEMKNNNISDETCSDWIDIVWASYENAFVNAQLYDALEKWSACEAVLGNDRASQNYHSLAEQLKRSFNKPVNEGGFWHPEKKQYIYWRDRDGSIHGDNLVTPVNFFAIAFGICDEPDRIASILDQIEERMEKENLFHWPLCFDSYKREEVQAGNWPFPRYENGDIFPTWGYTGVMSYVKYKPDLALKYIRKLLEQYEKDGLSSQRYDRKTQLGQGDDILAGICTSVTALYSEIYGVHPKWNRIELNPHLSKELAGTKFTYWLRDTSYELQLSPNDYRISTADYAVKSSQAFAVSYQDSSLCYFPGAQDHYQIFLVPERKHKMQLEVLTCSTREFNCMLPDEVGTELFLKGLPGDSPYLIQVNGKKFKRQTSSTGTVALRIPGTKQQDQLAVSD